MSISYRDMDGAECVDNEDDRWIITSLLQDKQKLKRTILALGGVVVLCVVVIIALGVVFAAGKSNDKELKGQANAFSSNQKSPCGSAPCYNGGRCTNQGEKYTCTCIGGFSGGRCQDSLCDDSPCTNGGLCKVKDGNTTCVCRFGFYGEVCQFDPCQKQPCINRGTCEVYKPDYRCNCLRGYSGKNCEVTPCDSIQCLNGGKCIERGHSYKCICTSAFVGHLCQESGVKDYLLMFSEAPRSDNHIKLYVWAGNNGTVTLQTNVYMSKKSYDVYEDSSNAITLSNDFFTSTGLSKKGLRVRSSTAIKLTGMVKSVAGDGFLAIPTERLGTKYMIPMYKPYRNQNLRKAIFGIVSKEDNTRVNITFTVKGDKSVSFNSQSYSTGETLSLTMTELGTVQIDHLYDLSGTTVSSDKPIGVVAGNKCNSIFEYYCNAFYEMILPVSQGDYSFIVPTIRKRNQTVVRVYCFFDTKLVIQQLDQIIEHDVQKGDFYETTSPHIAFINASRPVHVYSFPKDIPSYDSYMMTLPGTRQYKAGYDFIIDDASLTHHVSVTYIGLRNATSDFLLNGDTINPDELHVYYRPISSMKTLFNIVTFSLEVNPGVYNLRHTSNMVFGLWVYGEKSREGYGYPADINYL